MTGIIDPDISIENKIMPLTPKTRIVERVYTKPQGKEDLIKRILFDISQADFDKEEFVPVVELLKKIRDFNG